MHNCIRILFSRIFNPICGFCCDINNLYNFNSIEGFNQYIFHAKIMFNKIFDELIIRFSISLIFFQYYLYINFNIMFKFYMCFSKVCSTQCDHIGSGHFDSIKRLIP